MSEAPERIYIKRGWSDAHDGVWNSTKNLRGEELPPEEDEMPYVNADHLAALGAERDKLMEALIFARPLVEKWCHYQGDTKALFEQYLGPIDAALAKHGGQNE